MMVRKLKKRVFPIGGRPELVVYGDILPVFDATELRPLSDCSVAPADDAIRIFFFGGASAGNIPVEIPAGAATMFEDSEVLIKSEGNCRFGEWYGRARTAVNLASKKAVIVFPGLRGLNKDFISRFIFRPVLDALVCEKGYIPLHAAGVASECGGCIVSGEAGSGKTSLITGMLERGYDFLADDRILIGKDDNHGFSINAFPEYIRLADSPRRPKRLVSPPAAGSAMAPVKFILFLRKEETGNVLSLKPLGSGETFARLMHSVSPNLENHQYRMAFDLIGDMCGNIRSYLLSGWGQPQAWVDSVVEMIGEERKRVRK